MCIRDRYKYSTNHSSGICVFSSRSTALISCGLVFVWTTSDRLQLTWRISKRWSGWCKFLIVVNLLYSLLHYKSTRELQQVKFRLQRTRRLASTCVETRLKWATQLAASVASWNLLIFNRHHLTLHYNSVLLQLFSENATFTRAFVLIYVGLMRLNLS